MGGGGALIGGFAALAGSQAAAPHAGQFGGMVRGAGYGAAAGSMFGLPGLAIGAGVGAAAGGIKTLIDGPPVIKGQGSLSASAAAAKVAARAQQLFAAAELETGHASSMMSKQIAQAAVQQGGLAKSAAKVGLTQKDLTNAVTGSSLEYKSVKMVLEALGPEYAGQVAQLTKLRTAYAASQLSAQRQAATQGIVLAQFNRTTNAAGLLTAKQFQMGNATKNVAGTSRAFGAALANVTRTVKNGLPTLAADTMFGQRNRVALEAAAAASLRHAQAVTRRTGSVQAGLSVLQADRARLIETAQAAGLSAKQAGHLADKLFGIPPNTKANITTNAPAARAQINNVQTALNRLHNKQIDITTYVRNVILPGVLRDGVGPAGVSGEHSGPGGNVTGVRNPRQTARANGGPIFGPGTETSDSIPIMASNDEHMVSAREVRGLGGHGAVAAIRAAGRAGRRVPGFASGGAVTRTPEFSTPDKSTGQAFIRYSGVSGLVHAIKGQKGPAVQAMIDLGSAVSQAFKLKGVEAEITRIKARIASMKDYQAGVTGNLAQGFDPTKYGSVDDLVTGFSGATGMNTKFAGEIRKLRKEHLNRGFLEKLIAQGPSATLDTLAGSSMAGIARTNKALGGYNASLTLAGNAATYQKYGQTLGGAGRQEARAEQHQAHLIKSIDRLVHKVGESSHDVTIQIGNETVAKYILGPAGLGRLTDELGNHLTYGRKRHR